ncbi:MAG: hypothetical protein U0Q16_15430 [Bryobacteraceae bacterium]
MFIVRQGEQSPRVTLLQILLNSQGYRGANKRELVVDGIYGKNTRIAVEAAQGTGPSRNGAVAGPELWSRLLEGTGLAVVSSVDVGDPELMKDVEILRRGGDKPIVLGGMCNGIAQMVSEVTSRAQGQEIVTLRLDGHGNLGRWFTVSVGEVVDLHHEDPAFAALVDKEDMSYIAASNFAKVAPTLRHLTPLFAPFGFAEHHGCSLGSRPHTRGMMKRLANLWGVPIIVGIKLQDVGAVLDFSGPTFTAFPGRHDLRSWSRQFEHTEVAGMCHA